METSPLICRANQWTGFYMLTASVMIELILEAKFGDDPIEFQVAKIIIQKCYRLDILFTVKKQNIGLI